MKRLLWCMVVFIKLGCTGLAAQELEPASELFVNRVLPAWQEIRDRLTNLTGRSLRPHLRELSPLILAILE